MNNVVLRKKNPYECSYCVVTSTKQTEENNVDKEE